MEWQPVPLTASSPAPSWVGGLTAGSNAPPPLQAHARRAGWQDRAWVPDRKRGRCRRRGWEAPRARAGPAPTSLPAPATRGTPSTQPQTITNDAAPVQRPHLPGQGVHRDRAHSPERWATHPCAGPAPTSLPAHATRDAQHTASNDASIKPCFNKKKNRDASPVQRPHLAGQGVHRDRARSPKRAAEGRGGRPEGRGVGGEAGRGRERQRPVVSRTPRQPAPLAHDGPILRGCGGGAGSNGWGLGLRFFFLKEVIK